MNHQLSHYDLLWAVRRLPKATRDLLKAHPLQLMVAGGYLRSIVCGDPVNDVDIFAPTKEIAEACAKELAAATGKSIHESPNAYTLRTRPFPVQIIHRWTFDSPEAAILSFDFTIARAAFWWTGKTWDSCADEAFYPDLAARRLVYKSPLRIEEAGGSMLRVLKFYQRGYRIPLDSLGAVIARLASSLDLKRAGDIKDEHQVAKVLTGFLREVDPAVDPDHIAHLPVAGNGSLPGEGLPKEEG